MFIYHISHPIIPGCFIGYCSTIDQIWKSRMLGSFRQRMKKRFTPDELKAMRITLLGSVELNSDDMDRIYMPILIKHYEATWNSSGAELLCQCGKIYIRRDHYEQHQQGCIMNPVANPLLCLRSVKL